MIESNSTIRVRYAETDMMGVVYHGNYAPWLEVARTDLFRREGLSYRKLEEAGYRLPVLSLAVKYLRPAIYDDEITIHVCFKGASGLRLKLEYEVKRGDELLATASTEHAFVDRSGQPTRPPRSFTDLVAKYFEP